jgi:dTDP-4-amino-4,6-dideoxygalactose transaminase
MSQNSDFIPFARPSIGTEEEEAVLRVMRSGWLTTGAETLAFEQEFADFVGAPHAMAVNSATSGLHLALEALGIGPNDVVVTSPYTFTSTAAVVRHLGAEVAFCDTAPGSYNIDPDALGRILASTKNCRAIIAVHVGGLPCDMKAIKALAQRYGCAVVEDSAHSFPSKTADGYAGTIGDIGVYSFYATKTITTGEGGMVVTKDGKLAARIAMMRMHGFDRVAWDRYTSRKASWQYAVKEAGFKYNLPDLLSAIGREQLKKAGAFLEQRRAIAAVYDESFKDIAGLEIPPRGEGHAWHLYSLRTRPDRGGPDRDILIERLMERGIGTSVHFIPLHTMPYYAERYGLSGQSFPNAMTMFERTVSLPIWQGMGTGTALQVASVVKEIARSSAT